MSGCSCIFPNEILEKILYYCDIETLENARKIDESWNNVVWSMFASRSFWSRMCKMHMHKFDLYEYEKEFFPDTEPKSNKEIQEIWMHMYRNWISWSHIASSEISHRRLTTNDIRGEICCTKIIDNYLLVGTSVGYVYQYDVVEGISVSQAEHAEDPILNISAMDKKTTKNLQFKSPYVFLQFINEVFMYQVEDERLSKSIFPIIKLKQASLFCIHEDRFAYIDTDPKLHVGLFRNQDNRLAMNKLWTMSVDDSSRFGLSIWNDHVTVAFMTKMVSYKFKDFHAVSNDPDVMRSSKMLLYIHSLSNKRISTAIDDFTFYRGIFVTISYDRVQFRDMSEVLVRKKCNIGLDYGKPTHVCMHGRLLIIGCERGKVYFYRLTNWEIFDLQKYDRLERLCDDSRHEKIAHLTVSEKRGLHRVVVATSKSIRFFEIDVQK